MILKNKIIVCLLLMVVAALPATAKDFYVDANNGKDSNPGTFEEPFQTIGRATDQMEAGDVCYIREGVYRETLVPRSDQLTFKAYGNEYVIISGLDIIEGWTPYTDNIWKAKFKRPIPPGSFKASMVFMNGKRMNWARYPNEDGDMLNNDDMSKVQVGADTTVAPNPRYIGTVVFDKLPITTEKSWKGAYFVGVASYNKGAWFTANKGRVKSSNKNFLTVENISWNWNNGVKKGRFLGEGYGYLIGHMNALDTETEWHLEDDVLYFYPPKGTDMDKVQIEARSRTLGLDLSGRKGIGIQGIHFKAAGVKMENAENCVLSQCSIRYASSFSGYNEHAWGDYKNGDGGIFISGSNNTVKDCYIGQTWGNGIALWGNHNTLENSIVEHCNWQAERLSNVSCPGDDNVIIGNTIRYGAREGIELGNDRWVGKYARRALIKYNHVHDLGLLCPDGGLFYVNHQGGTKPLANTEISYNIWHDYTESDGIPRPHGGIYLDNMSSGYKIHHNVIWNVISGVHMNDIARTNNTREVFVYHNTFINCEYAVRVNEGKLGSTNTENIVVQNNHTTSGSFDGTILGNNRRNVQVSEFVDSESGNYRLYKGSASIDAGTVLPGINDHAVGAPDLGAHEFNGPDWKAGASIEVPDFPDEHL